MDTSTAGTTIHGFPDVSDQEYRKITSKSLTRVSFFKYFYEFILLTSAFRISRFTSVNLPILD